MSFSRVIDPDNSIKTNQNQNRVVLLTNERTNDGTNAADRIIFSTLDSNRSSLKYTTPARDSQEQPSLSGNGAAEFQRSEAGSSQAVTDMRRMAPGRKDT